MRRPLPPEEPPQPIEHPWFAAFALAVLACMVVLFVFGEELPHRIVPPAVAVIGASLALLIAFAAKIEPVDDIVRDVDWKTLLFLAGIFCLVRGVREDRDCCRRFALKLYAWFGTDLHAGRDDADRGHRLAVEPARELTGRRRLDPDDQRLPGGRERGARDGAGAPASPTGLQQTLPVFIAMMFGATLGGNATLIGASANVVAAGACAAHGRRVTFGKFLRYGLPIMVCQLAVSRCTSMSLSKLIVEIAPLRCRTAAQRPSASVREAPSLTHAESSV